MSLTAAAALRLMGKGASRLARMPAQELEGTLRRSTVLARHRCDQVRGSEPKPQLRHSMAWDAKALRCPWGSNQEGHMWGDPVRWPWRSTLQLTCKEPGSTPIHRYGPTEPRPHCCSGHPLTWTCCGGSGGSSSPGPCQPPHVRAHRAPPLLKPDPSQLQDPRKGSALP